MAAGHMPYMIKFVPLFITIETWSKYRQQLNQDFGTKQYDVRELERFFFSWQQFLCNEKEVNEINEGKCNTDKFLAKGYHKVKEADRWVCFNNKALSFIHMIG